MTEESLMAAVKQGDLQKASLLFDLYHRRLYGFFTRVTFDRELGRDLTQNVFYRLIRYRHTYKEDMPFQSWIFQMARNVYADHHRKNRMLFSDFTPAETLEEKTNSPMEDIMQSEKERLLHTALSKLPADQREILVLSRFEQMKYEEIARIMNLTVANVKIKVHRAILKLKEIYFQLEKC